MGVPCELYEFVADGGRVLSPLFKLAVLSGAQTAVRFHIQRNVDLDARDGDGRTPLMLAALKGDIEICRLLLESGADPALVDRDGKDALTLAFGPGGSGAGILIREYLALLDRPTESVDMLPSSNEERLEEIESNSADEETLDVSHWQEEIESPAPAGDASCVYEAEAVQRSISEHTAGALRRRGRDPRQVVATVERLLLHGCCKCAGVLQTPLRTVTQNGFESSCLATRSPRLTE